jgi:hypothetical protein
MANLNPIEPWRRIVGMTEPEYYRSGGYAGLGEPDYYQRGAYGGQYPAPGSFFTYPGTGSGGGAPEAPSRPKPPPLTWKNAYGAGGYGPKWWNGLVANKLNPTTEYIMLTNAMLPFLSPEDRRAFASNIDRQFKGEGVDFGDSTRFQFGVTKAVTPGVRANYLSVQRAQSALSSLERMRAASGFKADKFGPGLQYLRQVADTLRDFGTSGRPMSRAEYTKFLGAVDPLLNEAKSGKLGAYGALAKAFLQPFLTGGSLMNASRTQSGRIRFGAPNPKLFG